MPYYAVHSGNVLRCVLADDVTTACVTAVTQHINDSSESMEPCSPGELFEVAEFGKQDEDNYLVSSKLVYSAGGFASNDSGG